jgi:glycosyltransferase involved in cell wall biosynthesis
MNRLWVDVGDLFNYAGVFRRPSGVQRVLFELGQALAASDPDGARTGFVRHGASGDFVPVRWADITALFAGLSDEAPAAEAPRARKAGLLAQAVAAQLAALRALLAVPASLLPAPSDRTTTPAPMRPDDMLLIAGTGWTDPHAVARVAAAKARCGVQVALLVYDIVPLRRPEWFNPITTARFREWLDGMLALSERLLAISVATAQDLAAYRRECGLPDRVVHPVRLGDGFSDQEAENAADPGIDGPYALFVSTIEIRKNHALLVDVWRRLIARLGADQVPALVFAGREGELTGDLLAKLRTHGGLDGKIILRHTASDADIAALYSGCAFTLFPSLYEGWGLPVTESLVFGKPCFASSATSIPEAGGRLARYFDPLDPDDATRQIERLLQDPVGLAAWQAEITRDFRPVPWRHTAETMLAGLA